MQGEYTQLGWETQIAMAGGRVVFSCWNASWAEAIEWIGFQNYAGPFDMVTLVEASEDEALAE